MCCRRRGGNEMANWMARKRGRISTTGGAEKWLPVGDVELGGNTWGIGAINWNTDVESEWWIGKRISVIKAVAVKVNFKWTSWLISNQARLITVRLMVRPGIWAPMWLLDDVLDRGFLGVVGKDRAPGCVSQFMGGGGWLSSPLLLGMGAPSEEEWGWDSSKNAKKTNLWYQGCLRHWERSYSTLSGCNWEKKKIRRQIE